MDKLKEYGQEHLLQFVDELSEPERDELVEQISAIDFEQLKRLTNSDEEHVDWGALSAQAEPPPAVRMQTPHPNMDPAKARAAGEDAIRDGRVGMILVAGGQGTRLGFDKPKGMFPISPISQRTLFQMHCDRLIAMMRHYSVSIPLFIMTSPATDSETRDYFKNNDLCGLTQEQLRIFCQGTMPAVSDADGKVLLKDKCHIALSPDGHGGLVSALDKNGCLKQARDEGIDLFFYAQVDNPLVQSCDPELIGYHLLANSQLTTQVVQKRFAKERVGNVVAINGKVQIIEYSDLPDEFAEQTNADGSLKLWAGNIAVHVFDRDFLMSVTQDAVGLPFHRAHKKVPHIDATGQPVTPDKPNAIKFERFVFDLLPLAKNALVVEGNAAEIFAPVKNAAGAEVDTAETSQAAQIALHRKWLREAGIRVDDDIRVEIHPDWALTADDVKQKVTADLRIDADTFLH